MIRSLLSNDPGHQIYTVDEIISQVAGEEESSVEEEDEGEEEEELQILTSAQKAAMLEQCLMWYEHQPEATPTSLNTLRSHCIRIWEGLLSIDNEEQDSEDELDSDDKQDSGTDDIHMILPLVD